VLTLDLAGQRVDVGACFAFDPSSIPQGLAVDAGRFVPERNELGICRSGTIHFGATPLDCVQGMRLDRETWREIHGFACSNADAVLRGTDTYALMSSLMHQIHPGRLVEYDSSHQRDGLYTWYPDHWEHGNQALVEALLSRGPTRLLLNAEVQEVTESADAVELSYSTAGEVQRVECSAAVIAVTADAARSLLPSADLRCRRLLNATRYAGYIVVALAGVKAAHVREFRCLVPVDRSLAAVIQQRTADRASAVLLCYYCGPGLQELAASGDEELIALTRRELFALGIDKDALSFGVAPAVKRWPVAATILSPEYLACGSDSWERMSDRIYLAGDYVSIGRGTGYGLADAIASGTAAARRVREVINR
jgi:monoamine oxidase